MNKITLIRNILRVITSVDITVESLKAIVAESKKAINRELSR